MKRRNFITAAILAVSAAPAKVSAYAPIDQYAVECKRLKESVHRIFGENVSLTVQRDINRSCGDEHCNIFVVIRDGSDRITCLFDKNVPHADVLKSVRNLIDFVEMRGASLLIGNKAWNFDNGQALS